MKLLADVSGLLARYARTVETYVYALVGVGGADLGGLVHLSLGTTSTVALAPAAVALVHDALGDLRQLKADVKAVEAAPAQDAK